MKSPLILFFVLGFIFSCTKETTENQTKILNQFSQPLSHLDPQLSTGLSSSLALGKIYEGLMEVHPFDGPYHLLPNLAQEMPKVSSSGLIYRFKIRNDIQYQDCTCFDRPRFVIAEDFINSFKRIADPKLSSPYYHVWSRRIKGLKKFHDQSLKSKETDYSKIITGLKAIDKYTLEIEILNPDHYFLHQLSNQTIAPIPLEAIKFYKNDFSSKTIGTGPYQLVRWIRKSSLLFDKFKNFRKKIFPSTASKKYLSYIKNYQGSRVPLIPKIRVQIINESQSAWLNFLRGKLDYIEIPKDSFSTSVLSGKSLSPEMKKKGIVLGLTKSNSNIYYFGLNNKKGPTKNLFLRKAIALAFDQNKYNELFHNNTAVIATTILPPGIPGNTPPLLGPYGEEKLEEARVLLKKHGHENGKGLSKLTLSIRASTQGRQIGDYFVSQMKKIGLQVSINLLEWGSLLSKVQKGDYQIFYLSWFVGIPSANAFFDLLYGGYWPDSYNRVGFTHPEFDRLYDQAATSRNLKANNLLYRKMNKIMLKNLPLIPLVHVQDYFVRQAWLVNYIPSEFMGAMEQYYDIDLELKKKYLSLKK